MQKYIYKLFKVNFLCFFVIFFTHCSNELTIKITDCQFLFLFTQQGIKHVLQTIADF